VVSIAKRLVDVKQRTFPGVAHEFIGMHANVPEVLRAKAAFGGTPPLIG
jgi:hypothetical protein